MYMHALKCSHTHKCSHVHIVLLCVCDMVLTHRKCHHPETITSVTLKCGSRSCHSDVVLSVVVQPVQDHILLAVPVTDLVLAGSSSRLVVHLQWGGERKVEGGEGRGRGRGGGGRGKEGRGGGEGEGEGGGGRGMEGEGGRRRGRERREGEGEGRRGREGEGGDGDGEGEGEEMGRGGEGEGGDGDGEGREKGESRCIWKERRGGMVSYNGH